MLRDHRFPIVATMPDGSTRSPLHMTIGPALDEAGEIDPDGEQVTILWAWSAAHHRGYPFLISTNEPVLVQGRSDIWRLHTEAGVVGLRYNRSASCCGDPMKKWRPPGTGARRRGRS